MTRLGLSDEELMTVLEVDPLSVITDELDHRPEVGILLALTEEAEERAGGEVLRRWLRSATASAAGAAPGGASRRPIDLLLARDFAAFEDALGELEERGFVLRGGRA
jgi:hypothetical protein